MRGGRLTATAYVCIQLDGTACDAIQRRRVAVVTHSSQLALDVLHADLHVDNRLGRVEEAAIARTRWHASAMAPVHMELLSACLTPQATAASRDSHRHWNVAAAPACEPRVWGTGTHPPSPQRSVDPALRPSCLRTQAAAMQCDLGLGWRGHVTTQRFTPLGGTISRA